MEKRQKYLILVLILTVIIFMATLLWQNVFKKTEAIPASPVKVSVRLQEIKINFDPLKTSVFKDLQPLPLILPPEEGPGREEPDNPFTPYK